MLHNLRAYNADDYKQQFVDRPLYARLLDEYDFVDFKDTVKIWTAYTNPRQQLGQSRFSVASFYYLDHLLAHQPREIYDLGCGWNIFQKYVPNIVGVSPEDTSGTHYFGQIHDYVDQDYIDNHKNYFDCVFSINALHFVPMSQLKQRVSDFVSMIKPGGRGYLALNASVLLERDPDTVHWTIDQTDQYIRCNLSEIAVNYEIVDINLDPLDEWLDGNIRILCHKIT